MTPQKVPSAVRTLAGCRSPWSHRRGPVHSGAAAASSQTARIASGSGTRPSSVAEASCWANPSAWPVSGPPRPRPSGAPAVAGRCSAVRKAARVSAAWSARVAGARSAGSPGTQVVRSQGRGKRGEGSPRCRGTGTGSGRCGARPGSQACSLRSSASAASVAHGSRTARRSPSRHIWLSQPRAARLSGRPARSGWCSRSRDRTSSGVASVWVMPGDGSGAGAGGPNAASLVRVYEYLHGIVASAESS